MPNGQFGLPRTQSSQALAQAVQSSGMGYPVPEAAPGQGANDILALLQSGKLDPKAMMALLALLAGMGPQGPVPGGMPQQGAMPMPPEMGQSPIAQAYGG